MRPPPDDLLDASPGQRTALLFLVSVLGLFVELMLIRWIGTEIRIFAYLQNTVLVVCFLGLGMGCWSARKPAGMHTAVFAFFAIIALLTIPFLRQYLGGITGMLSFLDDFHIWEAAAAQDFWHNLRQLALGLFLTLVVMTVVWEVFMPVGRTLARLLDDHPRPIVAYSVNIAGSFVGILAFVACSAYGLPPYLWCAVAAVLFLPFLDRHWMLCALLLAGAVALGCLSSLYPDTVPKTLIEDGPTQSEKIEVVWSPYQKLYLKEYTVDYKEGPYKYLDIEVNNSTYQTIHDCRHEHFVKYPWRYKSELLDLTQYDAPLLFKKAPKNCLVVGAGNGNDVAGALRHGAERVVAVEIDPFIIEMGKRFHPEKPYASPKVQVVNDDARAYFANTQEKFDLIIFGLLDSHTTTAMTNARLDHYVYTRESLAQAKKLLAPGGMVVLSFYVERPFIGDRMATLIKDTFGHEPLYFRFPYSTYGRGGVLFVAGDPKQTEAALAADPRFAGLIKKWKSEEPLDFKYVTAPATDDWPYIYLAAPTVPLIFAVLALLMAALFIYGLQRMQTRDLFKGWSRDHWHFFFLGAAFMLLEVQNVSKAAVVLGNTWEVNAVMIGSILLLILFANLVVSLLPRLPLLPVWILLIGSSVGLYFVELAQFGALPYLQRAAVVGGLASLPMFFSGIIFMRSFAQTPAKDSALGANLLGSLVGALLQTLTFLTGIKALLLIVAGLYFVAFLTRPSAAAAAPRTMPSGAAA